MIVLKVVTVVLASLMTAFAIVTLLKKQKMAKVPVRAKSQAHQSRAIQLRLDPRTGHYTPDNN